MSLLWCFCLLAQWPIYHISAFNSRIFSDLASIKVQTQACFSFGDVEVFGNWCKLLSLLNIQQCPYELSWLILQISFLVCCWHLVCLLGILTTCLKGKINLNIVLCVCVALKHHHRATCEKNVNYRDIQANLQSSYFHTVRQELIMWILSVLICFYF